MKFYFYCTLFIFLFFAHLQHASVVENQETAPFPENFLKDLFRPGTDTSHTSPREHSIEETKKFYSLPSSPAINHAESFPINPSVAAAAIPSNRHSSSDWDDIEKKDIDRIKISGKKPVILVKGATPYRPDGFNSIIQALNRTIQTLTDPLQHLLTDD